MKSFIKRLRNISLVFVLLIWQVVFAGAPLIQSNLAHAAGDPDHVNFTLEGCRNDGTITLPNGSGQYVCPDAAYTTGNLGKGWNELDLVPFRTSVNAGTSAPSSQTYTFVNALDNEDSGHPGYDVISAPILNTSLSSASCVAAVSSSQLTLTPGVGGTDSTIYRTWTVTQSKNTTCVYDWYGRLALGSHLYPGSSLHADLLNQSFGTSGIGAKDVSIPVNEILPQELSKDMAATRDSDYSWTVSKLPTPATVNFGDVCSANYSDTQDVAVKVTWTRLAPTPSGDVTLVTNVYATNPASRTVTVTATDTMYEGSTQTTQVGVPKTGSPTDVPANTANYLVLTDTQVVPSTASSFNDVATATYTDKATGIPVPGQTSAAASATVTDGNVTNSTATVTDSESITGSGLTFESAAPSVGSYTNYTASDYTTGPVDWSSNSQSSSGDVTFSKTIKLDPKQITSGTLSDTATLNGSDGFTTTASAKVNISSTATVKLTINKNIPNVLEGNETQTFHFHVYDSNNNDVADPSITFTAGQTSKSVDVTGLAPGSYRVAEDTASGWNAQSDQNVSINLPSCSNSVTFDNTFTDAIAKAVKITDPTGHQQGWTFTLHNPDGSTTDGVTDASGDINFGNLTAEGSYYITETGQTGWYQSKADGCSFTVDYPADAGKTFTCTITNTEYSNISGYKYEVNADRTQVGTNGLSGWTITLYDSNGNQVGQSYTTDVNGYFVFTNLMAGSYTLKETNQNGWTQIFGPGAITLTTGDTSQNNNFGNFKNASISGYKFDDANGNGAWDKPGETGLQGWTINLSKSDGNGGWTPVSSDVTGNDGSYSFTNLAPDTYQVCEDVNSQAGYVQTYPTTNGGCHIVTVALSGHDYTTDDSQQSTDFGNQGRSTITVIKNVDDGFGNVTKDVTNWTWGYDGQEYQNDITTGSTNSQNVAAGDYSIWENSQNNYHFTSVSCSNDTGTVTVDNSSQFDVSLDPGENLTCTFTNTRDTGTITVIKELYPSSDPGKFNLQINGQNYATNVGDQGTTGAVTVITGDNYTVSETAGTGTSLSDYQSDYWCNNDQGTYGQGTQSSDFSVSKDQNITCIFENIRLGTLTGEKFNDLNGNGQKDSGEPGLQGWTINLYDTTLGLNLNSPIQTTTTDSNGDYTFNDLPSGDYRVCEVQQSGWTQTYPGTNSGCMDFTINIAVDDETGQPGQVVTADFGNFRNGTISGFKFSDANGNGKYEPSSGDVKLSGWTITLSKSDGNGGWTQINSTVTDSSGDYSFTNLAPGDYQVCEVPQTGWIRIFPAGSNCQTESINQSGQTVTALFANQKKTTPKVLGAVTELANTGQSAWAGIVAGLIMLSLIIGINIVPRQAKKQR